MLTNESNIEHDVSISLSLRERAGVRGPRLWKKPLTLTLSQRERE
jgi:hypothetical protein